MMESVREYFLQIVAVCMIAAICDSLLKNPLLVKVIRLVSGILILLVVIAPLTKIDITKIPDLFDDSSQIEVDMDKYHAQFQLQVQQATQEHIERIASELGMNIRAEVTVSDDEIPIPIGIEIIGSPPAEKMLELSDYIETQLGIPKQEQKWRRND